MDNIIKILLIDKEHAEYLLVSHLLAQVLHTDYQLTWLDRLDDAIEYILSDKFDVVLLDYHWQQHDCLDLLNRARAQGGRVPIIVMTTEREEEVDREAIRSGASDYLIKGHIDRHLLERTIRYAIERKTAEIHLARLAHYDPLTNIPNRILFRDRLDHAIQLAAREKASFALMYMDLNGFKQINDNFGHDAGDALIRACAKRLVGCMRKSDSVARIGGDEFTLLLEHAYSTADIAHIAEKVIDVISRPYQIGSYQVMIGCSIGIAIYPEAGTDIDNLQKSADMAMYKAKQTDGGGYRFFTEAMNLEARRQLLLESELRRAIRRDELCLHYQPRVDLNSGEILGVEALLRWNHPDKGLLLPGEFIAIAEDTGLIVPIGYWVIYRACLDLKRMQQAGLPSIVMAINLSPRQFTDDKLVERVASIAQKTAVDLHQLEFEITETAVTENLERAALCMRALQHLGCRFALDDFGTGYSSFLHLQRMPISTIKIDRAFIKDSTRKADDATLVKSMIDLAHSLGKDVIGEGVETAAQVELLRDYGCDQTQGFYFYKPLSFDVLAGQFANANARTGAAKILTSTDGG